ncbi:hypothetical protein MRB53_026150 [Persea americana]|uniref:Uncharacterized protein n=1 Tax=Persea americana TaxID=3435 RepID=A0ACC2LHC3_PERAE|nr:hypothetical protein MRB53_026150 [Persea americana]
MKTPFFSFSLCCSYFRQQKGGGGDSEEGFDAATVCDEDDVDGDQLLPEDIVEQRPCLRLLVHSSLLYLFSVFWLLCNGVWGFGLVEDGVRGVVSVFSGRWVVVDGWKGSAVVKGIGEVPTGSGFGCEGFLDDVDWSG